MHRRILAVIVGVVALTTAWRSYAAYESHDITCETTTTNGTGTVDLSGTGCDTVYVTWVTQVTSGATVPYTIESGDGKIETGIGTFTDAATDTLSRDTVYVSTDGVATALNLSGTSKVFLNWNSATLTGGLLGVSFLNVDVAGTTVPVNGIYEPSANVLGFSANTTAEAALSATAFYPATSDGNALGSTTNQWSDLFLAEGGVINWDNGDCIATQTGDSLALTSCDLTMASLAGGTHTIWVGAQAMTPQTTNGCVQQAAEYTTNDVMVTSCSFSASVDEYAQFTIGMPKSSNEGTVTVSLDWYAIGADASDAVVWNVSCQVLGDGDALDDAFGAGQSVTDNLGTESTLRQSSATAALTPDNTWAEGDDMWCRVSRDADNVSDTYDNAANLLGVRVLYGTNTGDDS